MIIIVNRKTTREQLDRLVTELEQKQFKTHLSKGENTTIIGLIGDTSVLDIDSIKAIDIVDDVRRVTEPYKKANRKFHEDDTVVDVNGVKIGGGNFAVIAGPCSVESKEQMREITKAIQKSGANFLRGGAYKPRTSPYAFQGLQEEGIELLLGCKEEFGIPIVSEIMDVSDIPFFENVDVIQVGARNMQNFRLLKELGKLRQPILLKRGLANTIEEWLMSAEYIMAGGNENIILCERGIRTFETYTRNTFDISAIPVLKRLTHLPVIADPSHAAGMAWLVEPLAKAAVAAGADGVMIEVHNDPAHALSDGMQSLTPEMFDSVIGQIKKYL
ncbi:3-deoxy-7-phosphoheptulonate synthase [Christensenellaceae bacterium OttesenSCG-928-K19]|nr:3-deoxy-7-phosphoheptulonate synthase [Christensenellaceae bacterium OttesenSCG-928-K19]